MSKNKYICLLTSFKNLNASYHTQKNFYNYISSNFSKFFFINSDNLKFFANPKKYYFSSEVLCRPENIILVDPKNSREFKDFVKDKILIMINNIGKTFVDLKTHFLLKNNNIKQIQCKNIGNIQATINVSWEYPFRTIKFLVFNRIFRKITTILAMFKLINNFDITFISNKKILNLILNSKIKNFLYKKKLLFTKEFLLVNSKFFDEIKLLNKKISTEYIVHLDFYLNYYEEVRLRGKLDHLNLKKHHDLIENFLTIFQKKLNKKVVICIHPLYPTSYFESFYKKFEIVKYRTAEFISRADTVTFFDSSAVINALLLKKRVIQLNSSYMGINMINNTEIYRKPLDLIKVELENFKETDFEIIYGSSKIKDKHYTNYISTFHCFDDKISGTQKIVDVIKNRYF